MTLTREHNRLLKNALNGKAAPFRVTPEQRAAIRQICADLVPSSEPEKLLVAFKVALGEAANAAHIAVGVERSAMTSKLVSLFIEELYAAGVDDRIVSIRRGNVPLAPAPQLILENGSSGALP